MGVDGSGVAVVVGPPDGGEDALAVKDLAGVGSEEVEDLELLGRHVDELALDLDFIIVHADFKAGVADDPEVLGGLPGSEKIPERLDPGEDLAGEGRFGDVVGAAKLEAKDPVDGVGLAGQKENGGEGIVLADLFD